MNAPVVEAPPDPHRSTPHGPPLPSAPSAPGGIRPVPSQGPDPERSGGPAIAPQTQVRQPPRDAPSPLSRCVGDVDLFASHHWGRQPLVTTPHERGDVDLFDDVLSLDAVDQLVANGARRPSVRMVADGVPLPAPSFCSPTRIGGRELDDVVDPAKVASRLADGATLVLQSLHRTSSTVGDFVRRLQDEVSHPVQANAYLTPPAAAGLGEHADLHDVLAIQLHGSKRWWIDGLGEVTMRPGDVMYVPRGVRHHAETSGDTSLHLTIGIIRVTRRHVIERMLRAGSDALDDPLPIGYRHRSGRDDLERTLDETLDAALDLIGSADLSDLVGREQARRLARPPRSGRITSIAHVDAIDLDTVICWIAPEPLAQAVDDVDGQLDHWDGLRGHDHWSPRPERITVDLGDRTLTLPTTTLRALRTLSEGGPVRVGDLPGLDEPSRIVLAQRLVREAACVVERLVGRRPR